MVVILLALMGFLKTTASIFVETIMTHSIIYTAVTNILFLLQKNIYLAAS